MFVKWMTNCNISAKFRIEKQCLYDYVNIITRVILPKHIIWLQKIIIINMIVFSTLNSIILTWQIIIYVFYALSAELP